MTRATDRILTSSGFYVSQETPIETDNPTATPRRPRRTSCDVPIWSSWSPT